MSDEPRAIEVESKACRHGRFTWLKGDIYIGRSLSVYGEYCEPELQMLLKFLKPGDCVIESGSNIGADTVPLAKHVGASGHVFAIEPQPVIFRLLAINLRDNELRNVTALNCGTHIKNTKASIPSTIDYTAEDNFGGIAMAREGLGEEIILDRLDTLVPPSTRVAMIKADVEGMELQTLLGASAIIGASRPVIYVENNLGPRSAELIRFLTQINYRCWWHVIPLFSPDNWSKVSENLFPETASLNMICLPTGDPRTVLIEGLNPVINPRDRPPEFGGRSARP